MPAILVGLGLTLVLARWSERPGPLPTSGSLVSAADLNALADTLECPRGTGSLMAPQIRDLVACVGAKKPPDLSGYAPIPAEHIAVRAFLREADWRRLRQLLREECPIAGPRSPVYIPELPR